MNDDIWYKEELLPPEAVADQTSKPLQKLDMETLAREIGLSKAALAADEAGQLPGSEGGLLEPGKLAQGPLYLVRQEMELDVELALRDAKWSYRQAWCRAHFFAPESAAQPRLLDIYPQRIYEGQQMKAESRCRWRKCLRRVWAVSPPI